MSLAVDFRSPFLPRPPPRPRLHYRLLTLCPAPSLTCLSRFLPLSLSTLPLSPTVPLHSKFIEIYCEGASEPHRVPLETFPFQVLTSTPRRQPAACTAPCLPPLPPFPPPPPPLSPYPPPSTLPPLSPFPPPSPPPHAPPIPNYSPCLRVFLCARVRATTKTGVDGAAGRRDQASWLLASWSLGF